MGSSVVVGIGVSSGKGIEGEMTDEESAPVLAVAGRFVDWRFFLSWSRWPLAVAMDGDTSVSLMRSMPGHDCKSPFLMALRKVEIGGLPQAAWRYRARSLLDCFLWIITLAV